MGRTAPVPSTSLSSHGEVQEARSGERGRGVEAEERERTLPEVTEFTRSEASTQVGLPARSPSATTLSHLSLPWPLTARGPHGGLLCLFLLL